MSKPQSCTIVTLILISLFLGLPIRHVLAASGGVWTPAGEMAVGRSRHTATLLSNGSVLVAGGYTGALNGPVSTSTAEIYNPLSNTWEPASSMTCARSRHTATMLADGRVLVVGGRGVDGLATSSVEIYDPLNDAWSTTGSLQTARMDHTATLLADGRVFVTGGQSPGDGLGNWVEKTAEVYDPLTGRWTGTQNMAMARYGHSATLLTNGKVLVVGGAGPSGDSVYSFRAEIYDPAADNWRNVDSLNTPRGFHTSILLEQGDLIVAGGFTLPANSSVLTNSSELYDAASNRWVTTGSLNLARNAGESGGVLLPGRSVLIAGGRTNTAEVFEPATRTWTMTGSMTTIRSRHVLTLLLDGRVLVTGGENRNGFVTSAEVYLN